MLAFVSARRLFSYKCPQSRDDAEGKNGSYMGKWDVPVRRAWYAAGSSKIFIGLLVRVWFYSEGCIEFA